MLEEIKNIIETELKNEMFTRSENMRVAAWYVMEEFPSASARDFSEAALSCGFHAQGARNRWNEAVKNLEVSSEAV